MNDNDFRKLTKAEKLKMSIDHDLDDVKCTKALFIPIRQKMDGYGMSATFILAEKGWVRVPNYDCFDFYNAQKHLRGDFEYNGVVFFLEGNWYFSYANRFYYQK